MGTKCLVHISIFQSSDGRVRMHLWEDNPAEGLSSSLDPVQAKHEWRRAAHAMRAHLDAAIAAAEEYPSSLR